jgi:hypothetical protein
VSEKDDDGAVIGRRETLRIALPLVIATVASRTVWAANRQTQGSTCGSCVPSGQAQKIVAP